MNSFETIIKYSTDITDDYFVSGSKTAILENGRKFIDLNFKEAGYVKIANILIDGASDYYRHNEGNGDNSHVAFNGTNYDGLGRGGVSLSWEIKKLRYLRGKQFQIDAISSEETANIALSRVLEHFIKYKIIPEVDEVTFSTLADATSVSLENRVVESAAIADNAIISKFNAASEWLSEHEVPQEEQIIFVNPHVMTLIKNTSELAKFLTQEDYRSPEGISFRVAKYDGKPIIEVPSSRFYTDVLVDANNGFRPNSGSKLINFMICSVRCCVPVRKLELTQVYGPEMSGLLGFHGYVLNYFLYHDCIIPDNKIVGIYCDIDNASVVSTKADALSIDTVAGSATNGWVLKNYFTNPAGLRGNIVYADTAFTLGAILTGTEGVDYFSVAKGEEVVDASASTHYFALVDSDLRIIAVSKLITLVKKA